MSSSAAERISPTAERIAKGDVQTPKVDRETNRPYHRALDEFARLYSIGALDHWQRVTAEKLQRHYLGSLGVDVRIGDDPGGDSVCEYPRTYHAQKLAQAQEAVTPRQWRGLLILLTEQGNIEAVGGAVCQVKNPVQARAAGRELIINGLDIIARLWGMR